MKTALLLIEKAVHEEIEDRKKLLKRRPELMKPPYNDTLYNEEELLASLEAMKKGLGVE